MKQIILAALLLILINASYSQSSSLSKEQMYQDFDTLVYKIEQISPHIVPKEIVWNYDILKIIKSYRKEIDTISSNQSFTLLIYKVINTCQDEHTSLMTDTILDKEYDKFKFDIKIKYLNGQYYVVHPFKYKDISIPFGSKVTKFNGMPINEYAEKYIFNLRQCYYDMVHKQFYNNYFYFYDVRIAQAGHFSMTFKTTNNIDKALNINIEDTVQEAKSNSVYYDKKNVQYWEKQQTLYIRVPLMGEKDTPYYKNEIASLSKGKSIKKVIIDIRNNPGGSDLVWQAIYEMVIPDCVSYPVKIVGNNPSYMSEQYIKKKELKPDSMQIEKFSFLNNESYYVYYNQPKEIVCPDTNSIDCRGKIIIVGNENIFSSGGSAMLIANANHRDNIISIGRHTGRFLGAGINPYISMLPNTKIEFRIEPAIDMANVKKAQDIMHDSYEITLPFTLKEYKDKLNYNGNVWSKDFLINHDPFITKALKL